MPKLQWSKTPKLGTVLCLGQYSTSDAVTVDQEEPYGCDPFTIYKCTAGPTYFNCLLAEELHACIFIH